MYMNKLTRTNISAVIANNETKTFDPAANKKSPSKTNHNAGHSKILVCHRNNLMVSSNSIVVKTSAELTGIPSEKPRIKYFGINKQLTPKRSRSSFHKNCATWSQKNEHFSRSVTPIRTTSVATKRAVKVPSTCGRVSNLEVKVLENLQRKVEDMQTELIKKYEALKCNSPRVLKNGYKFITLVGDGDCKLMVKNDCLVGLPKILPAASVFDLKQQCKSIIDSCLTLFMDKLKAVYTTNTHEDKAFTLNLDNMKRRFEKEQSLKLDELYHTIDELCQSNCACESNILDLQEQFTQSKDTLQTVGKGGAEIRNGSGKEGPHVEDISENRHKKELIRKNKVLEVHTGELMNVQKHVKELVALERRNNALRDDLDYCKELISNPKRKLQEIDLLLDQLKTGKTEIAHEMEEIWEQLEELKAGCKADDGFIRVNSEKLQEIEKLKYELDDVNREKRTLEAKLQEMNTIDVELSSETKDFQNSFKMFNNKQMEETHQLNLSKLFETMRKTKKLNKLAGTQQKRNVDYMEKEIGNLKHTVRMYDGHCKNSIKLLYMNN